MTRTVEHRVPVGLTRFTLLLACAGAFGQTVDIAPPPSSENINRFFGISVAGLADVDGDGWGDIAVGDHGGQVVGSPFVGRVHLYSGRTHALLRSIRPPYPNQFGGDFGYIVCGLRDVNGDGRGDLAVPDAVATDPGHPGAGVVRVYSGATGELLYPLRSEHEAEGLNFGQGLADSPDIDGDGIDDVIVGSPNEDDLGGAVYLFSGGTGALLRVLHPPQQPCSRCFFGSEVAGIPDLDGDGLADVAVGAVEPRQVGDPMVPNVYIFSGATGALLHTVPTRFRALAGSADLDGDGLGDILVGYPSGNLQGDSDFTGYVRVVSGGSGATIRIVLSPDYPAGGGFGSSLAGIADCQADGWPDILVGMRGTRVNFLPGAGTAYLIAGASGAPLRRLVSLRPQDQGNFGGSIASVPDVNGDGRPEVLVGAPQEVVGTSHGRAYLFLSCPVDMDADGTATSQDFFDYLNAFFSGNPRADFTRDGTINSQDFFEYLAAFFAGCP